MRWRTCRSDEIVADVDLRLRPLRIDDEAAFRAGHEAMLTEGFPFGFSLDDDVAWPDYLAAFERDRCGIDRRPGKVAATFLVADVDGVLIGRSSIRHELNEALLREGGHIGYAVLADHRHRGYATEILRQSLVIARSVGVDDVLVTCDDDNVPSRRVIERCGGVLESVVPSADRGVAVRRYWIR